MSIYIYNSLSRKKEEFHSLKPKEVKMYVCGPTVYDEPHIGHARSAHIFDVIRRYLAYKDYQVKFVRNVTDVDDKIINKAKEEFPGEDLNAACKKVAEKYLAAYQEALKSLNIGIDQEKIFEPRASEYIPKMVKFIQGLIDRGAAYVSGGDVYFDITKAKNYGKLSNQSLEKMESGVRVAPQENKRNPLDFALWKSAKENEPSWDSPFGRGRPGWHIECSVMSSDILGEEFDIHGGGIDLIFPHHENEIAQSEAAGEKFARYWIHHGLLTINGQKMAKSLGNFITVQDFLDKYKNADLLKLLFLSTHYTHPVDYTDEKIQEAKKSYERFQILFQKIDREFGSRDTAKLPTGSKGNISIFKDKFVKAMDDDFNTPQALGVLFDMVTECNKIFDSDKRFILRTAMETIIELANIFGLSFGEIKEEKSDNWVMTAIAMREQFRKDKKFKEADEIRKELEVKGIILEDTKDGTIPRRK
ncbi:MAG: cysteine--tRNA ligase [Candidatus Omnitrophica bacterium]|jgi:cysteinyl-tRNA synthetase|nr:cysteine--tRNA ligase [Candidatus Omnitrophota bacterium]MDD5518475.1 cysteine--tRNA ligase [Candidatus Omnitrophota bacterium]